LDIIIHFIYNHLISVQICLAFTLKHDIKSNILVLLSNSNVVKNNNNTVAAAAAAADTISTVRQQASNQPKVKLFLDTIDRNSLKTKKYETDLVHFQEFLNENMIINTL
jgi:hypothetical protein